MNPFAEYENYDATGLAELVRQGQVSALELLDAAWQRMEQRNPAINAVCWPDLAAGRAAARAATKNMPFAGVPFLLKDGGASATGLRLTYGSEFSKNNFPVRDSALAERYRKAGLVFFGRTTTPEYGINVATESPIYGSPTRNPWHLDFSPGGSSGGAAAAVAAGIVPMAHGSDGGGSLRIPASYCGLFALKPTRARMPHGPGYGESWSGMATSHVISRSVRDSALALDATHGPDSGAPYHAPAAQQAFLAGLALPLRPLRIGFITTTWSGEPVHGDCGAAVQYAAQLCSNLGHHVQPARLPGFDFELLARTMRSLVCANTAAEMDAMALQLGLPIERAGFEAATWNAREIGLAMSASDYLNALHTLHRLARPFAPMFEAHDVILTATLAEPPARVGQFAMNRDYVSHRTATLAHASLTPLANVTGQPAMSVPLHWNADGLPIGVQFVGPYGDETVLLQLAAQLEQACPWFDRLAPLARSG